MFRRKTTVAIVPLHEAPSDQLVTPASAFRELPIAEADKVAGGSRSSGSGAVKCVFDPT